MVPVGERLGNYMPRLPLTPGSGTFILLSILEITLDNLLQLSSIGILEKWNVWTDKGVEVDQREIS